MGELIQPRTYLGNYTFYDWSSGVVFKKLQILLFYFISCLSRLAEKRKTISDFRLEKFRRLASESLSSGLPGWILYLCWCTKLTTRSLKTQIWRITSVVNKINLGLHLIRILKPLLMEDLKSPRFGGRSILVGLIRRIQSANSI